MPTAVQNYVQAIGAYNDAARGKPMGDTKPADPLQQDDFAGLVRSAVKEAVRIGERSEQLSIAGINDRADINQVVTAVAEAEVTLQTVDTVDKLAKWRTVKISDFDFARDGWLQKASVRAQAAPGRKFGFFDRSLRLKNAWCGSVGKKFQAEFSRPSLSTVSVVSIRDKVIESYKQILRMPM